MSETLVLHFSTREICRVAGTTTELITEIVQHGIVEPEGATPDDWVFDNAMLSLVRQAVRLHRDLEVDWSGIALALGLLEQVASLRQENEALRQRLNRFLLDEHSL